MKGIYLLSMFIGFLFFGETLNAQTIQWAKKGVSPGYEYGNGIAADDSGNVYISGQIEYSTQFENITLSSNGIHDILVGKYAPDGTAKWLHHLGGTSGDVGYGVGVDAMHNSYFSGEIESTVDFGSGITLTSAGSNDIIIVKYDISGHIIWAKRFGNAGNDKSRAMAVSPSGDCYVTGYFSATTTFGSIQLTNSGGNDIYILKLNSSGNVVWAKKAGGGNDDRGYGIAFDKTGNVYVTGVFNGTATFSGTTISNTNVNGAFLAKYDASGNFQWVQKGGNCCNATESNCVAIDENGFIYTGGYFSGATDFGSFHFSAAGSTDIIFAKYNSSGNVVWAKQVGGPFEDIAYGLSVDTINHILYSTGQIDDYGYFDSYYVGTAGNRDVFVAASDMNGNFLWAKASGGNQRDIGYAITNDRFGNVYTTGIFNDVAHFGAYTLNGYPKADFFVDKISPAPAASPSTQSSNLFLTHFGCTDLNLSFTPGNGSRRIILAHEGSTVISNPVDGISYSANSVFGYGSNLGSSDFVVYEGNGNNVTVTGLTLGLTYYFEIFEYNGTGATINYLTTAPANANLQSGWFNVNISSSAISICSGDSAILIASAGSNFNWSPSVGLSSTSDKIVMASPLSTTTYLVSCDSNGCHAQNTITLIVNSNPIVSYFTADSVCENGLAFPLTGGTPTGGVYSGTGVLSGIFDPSVAGAGTSYIQYQYADSNGCSETAQSSIQVIALPLIYFTPVPDLCENEAAILLTNGNPSGGNYSGTGVSFGYFDPAIGSGIYSIIYEYSDSSGCSAANSFSVNVNQQPQINLGSDTTVCGGNIVMIDAGSGYTSYAWSSGETTSSVFCDSAGTGIGTKFVFVEVSNIAGCLNSDTVAVNFDLCSGINLQESDFDQLSIFPNPFITQSKLITNKQIDITIYDATGRLVESHEHINGTFYFGENLSQGIYFLDARSHGYKRVYRVLKSH